MSFKWARKSSSAAGALPEIRRWKNLWICWDVTIFFIVGISNNGFTISNGLYKSLDYEMIYYLQWIYF
jgi:hypothetical protein